MTRSPVSTSPTHAESAYELTESGAGGKFAGVGAAHAAKAEKEEVTV